MAITKKKDDDKKETSIPFNPPKIKKTETTCVVEGCLEEKAPGQTYVCAKHVRAG